jgi:hypothetical protein
LAEFGIVSLPPTFFLLVIAQFNAGQLKVVGIGAVGYLTLLAAPDVLVMGPPTEAALLLWR